MTLKRNAGLLAILLLSPLAASAQELPSLNQFMAELKTAPVHGIVIPRARAVAKAAAQASPRVPVDIYATPAGGDDGMVEMVDGDPVNAKVVLTLEKGRLMALYTSADPKDLAQQNKIAYQFGNDVAVAFDEVLYHGEVLGQIINGKPVLLPGYSLVYAYGGTIDAGTGADRAVVDVRIVSKNASKAPILATPKGGENAVSMAGGAPQSARVDLKVEGNRLGAVFAARDQQGTAVRLRYVFNGVDVAFDEILYHGTVIGLIDANANSALPVLNAGYALKYGYSGTIDAGTAVARAFVSVEIVKTAP